MSAVATSPVWQLAHAQALPNPAIFRVVSEQSLYNLTERTIELEVIPAARALGIGVILGSLAGGALGGILNNSGQGVCPNWTQKTARKHRDKTGCLRGACRRTGRNSGGHRPPLGCCTIPSSPGAHHRALEPWQAIGGSLGALENRLSMRC